MKEVLLKYAKTVKDKQKQEKQKKYKSLLDGKLKSKYFINNAKLWR